MNTQIELQKPQALTVCKAPTGEQAAPLRELEVIFEKLLQEFEIAIKSALESPLACQIKINQQLKELIARFDFLIARLTLCNANEFWREYHTVH